MRKILLLTVALVATTPVTAQQDEIRVCKDMSSYPTKVVVVCKHCQCPPGYY